MSKERVESCLTIGPPRGPLVDMSGTWYWRFLGCTARYSIHTKYQQLHVALDHRGHTQEMQLVRTKPNFGGTRWWFLCPQCGRRVLLLHQPSNAKDFFCRHCHELTYESAQLSGTKESRSLKDFANKLHLRTRIARQWYRMETNPAHVHEIKRPELSKVRDRRTGNDLQFTKEARSKGLSV